MNELHVKYNEVVKPSFLAPIFHLLPMYYKLIPKGYFLVSYGTIHHSTLQVEK